MIYNYYPFPQGSHKTKKVLGNVTAESDIIFGYQLNPNFKAELPEQIPFQVKTFYGALTNQRVARSNFQLTIWN